MKFDNAQTVESITWQMRQDEYVRSQNRALVDVLFNGSPPYTQAEVAENRIAVNTNNLAGVKLAHDARAQMFSAMNSTGQFFTARTDYGPVHDRDKNSVIITTEMNRRMKDSLKYFEVGRSQIALNTLHGIAPSSWEDHDRWCPTARGIDEIGILSGTLLTMENLPLFYIRRSYTAPQLIRMTRGPLTDPGWNKELVDECIQWVDEQTQALMSTSTWSDVWSPEKIQERVKGDGSCYASTRVATVDVFDFYFWSDEADSEGWCRRMVLDAWSNPGPDGLATATKAVSPGSRRFEHGAGEFLYNSNSRKYASKLSEIITWQFADLSAVAPFQYHSVRSLGFLLYSVCHLQNRLYCKFSEAVFENLMMYLRVKSLDDAERALKIELISRGFIDETVQFLRPEERWQVNQQLAAMGLQVNEKIIMDNASSYVQKQEFSQPKTEKTKYQVMAETNAQSALISAAVLQAYAYKKFEYREIFRRFMRPNSRDVDVREFRNSCLRQGVPEKCLTSEYWDLEPEKVLGAGNKTLQLQMSEWLMQNRTAYDPEAQKLILRKATFNITDDAALTEALVPEKPAAVSDSMHDSQLAVGTLMEGLPVNVKKGVNHIEAVTVYLNAIKMVLGRIQARGGMANEEELDGLQNIAGETIEGQPIPSGGVTNHLQILEQDPMQKEAVKKFSDALGQMMNKVKALAQQLEQQMQSQQDQNGQLSAEDQAKIVSAEILAKGKDERAARSHAEKTAQRRVSFDQKQQEDAEKHQLELKKEASWMGADLAARNLETQAQIAMEKEKVDKMPVKETSSPK